MLVITVAITFYIINQGEQGKEYPLRRLATLDRINEAVGRCAEMARPLFYSLGRFSSLTQLSETPATIAGLSLMDYTVKLAAERGVPTYSPQSDPAVSLLSEEIIEKAYIEAGRPELFNRGENVPYITQSQGMWITALLSMITERKPAALIQTGAFTGASGVWCERAHEVGAVTIAGTARPSTAYMVTFWDHWLIGEEALAAAAYVSPDLSLRATVFATDIAKWITIILIAAFYIIAQLGIDTAAWTRI
jgi:hypothetical protein